MCFLEKMTSAFDDFPFVVRDKIEEKVFKESSYWISAKVSIVIIFEHRYYLSPNITRAGLFQVLRQFLAASMWAVTWSSLNRGTLTGHLATPPLYNEEGKGAP